MNHIIVVDLAFVGGRHRWGLLDWPRLPNGFLTNAGANRCRHLLFENRLRRHRFLCVGSLRHAVAARRLRLAKFLLPGFLLTRFLLGNQFFVVERSLLATSPQLSRSGRSERTNHWQSTEKRDADLLIQTHDLRPLKVSLASI